MKVIFYKALLGCENYILFGFIKKNICLTFCIDNTLTEFIFT